MSLYNLYPLIKMQAFALGGQIQTSLGPTQIGPTGIFFAPSSDVGALEALGAVVFPGSSSPNSNTYYRDIDTSSGPQTFTLPTNPNNNDLWYIKDISGGHPVDVSAITVTAGGVILIDTAVTFPSPPMVWANFASFGFRWNSSLNKWLVQ